VPPTFALRKLPLVTPGVVLFILVMLTAGVVCEALRAAAHSYGIIHLPYVGRVVLQFTRLDWFLPLIPNQYVVWGALLGGLVFRSIIRLRVPRPIAIDSSFLHLPRFRFSGSMTWIVFKRLRQMIRVRYFGRSSLLLTDARKIPLLIQSKAFVDPKGLDKLETALRKQVLRRAGGQAHMDAIDHNATFWLRFLEVPWVTLALAATFLAAFLETRAAGLWGHEIINVRFGAYLTGLIAEGELFRLVTPIFVHHSTMDLVTNVALVVFLGWLAESIMGGSRMLLLALGSALLGYSTGVLAPSDVIYAHARWVGPAPMLWGLSAGVLTLLFVRRHEATGLGKLAAMLVLVLAAITLANPGYHAPSMVLYLGGATGGILLAVLLGRGRTAQDTKELWPVLVAASLAAIGVAASWYTATANRESHGHVPYLALLEETMLDPTSSPNEVDSAALVLATTQGSTPEQVERALGAMTRLILEQGDSATYDGTYHETYDETVIELYTHLHGLQRTAQITTALTLPGWPERLRAEAAWIVAIDHSATPEQLQTALATMKPITAHDPRLPYRATLATLHHRLGNHARAVEIGRAVWTEERSAESGSQLARYYAADPATRIIRAGIHPPPTAQVIETTSWRDRTIEIHPGRGFASGGRFIALMYCADDLEGIFEFLTGPAPNAKYTTTGGPDLMPGCGLNQVEMRLVFQDRVESSQVPISSWTWVFHAMDAGVGGYP